MKDMHYISSAGMVTILLQQLAMQQQLIETQQKLIEVQKQNAALERKINSLTPKTPKDASVFWHLNSDGVSSEEAARSNDLITVTQFYEWVRNFGKKYIRPYVNPKVYTECMNQMTRGLAHHMTVLEVTQMISPPSGKNGSGSVLND